MNTLAIINIAKAQLGLEEDDYRALLQRVTGKASLRQMSERQRIDVLDELKRKGFKVRPSKGGNALPVSVTPYVRLIHALWSSCHRLGAVDHGSRDALRAFCNRFAPAGVTYDPDLLSYAQATPIIEALKNMEARAKGKAA